MEFDYKGYSKDKDYSLINPKDGYILTNSKDNSNFNPVMKVTQLKLLTVIIARFVLFCSKRVQNVRIKIASIFHCNPYYVRIYGS